MRILLTVVLSVLIVASSIFLSGCNTSKKVEASQVEIASNSNSTKPKVGHHLCNGLTRSGKGCTRLVSDSHGKGAKCWQHQEKD